MRKILLLFFISFLTLQLTAQDDFPVTHVDVCNDGKIDVDVMTGAQILNDFSSGYKWRLEGWYRIPSGECGNIFNQNYRPRVFLAFAFTDSRGVWGWARLEPLSYSGDWKMANNVRLCARDEAFTFIRPQGDPTAGCEGEVYPVPASIDYQPSSWGGGLRIGEFRVNVPADLKAIPFGAKGSTGAAVPSPAPSPTPNAGEPTGGSILSQLATAIKENTERQQRELIKESIDTALSGFATGFNSYRRGPAKVISNGEREWWLIPDPGQTYGCYFRGPSNTATSFGCTLFGSANRGVVDAYYAGWLKSAMAVVPPDWGRADASAQLNGGLPAEQFVGPGGLLGALYVEQRPEVGKYVLFFSVVTLAH